MDTGISKSDMRTWLWQKYGGQIAAEEGSGADANTSTKTQHMGVLLPELPIGKILRNIVQFGDISPAVVASERRFDFADLGFLTDHAKRYVFKRYNFGMTEDDHKDLAKIIIGAYYSSYADGMCMFLSVLLTYSFVQCVQIWTICLSPENQRRSRGHKDRETNKQSSEPEELLKERCCFPYRPT